MAGTRNPKSPSRQSTASQRPRRRCAPWLSLDLPNVIRQKHGTRHPAEKPAASTPFRIARGGTARCPDQAGGACSHCWIARGGEGESCENLEKPPKASPPF